MSRSPRLPLDAYARSVITAQPHAIVAWWLMASYLYYCTDEALLTDACFDELTATLKARWGEIRHPHKRLIDRGMLEAGTGYYIRAADYPAITVSAAIRLAEDGPAAGLEVEAILNADKMFAEREQAVEADMPPQIQELRGPVPAPEQGELFG